MRDLIIPFVIVAALATAAANGAPEWNGRVAGRVVSGPAAAPVAGVVVTLARTLDATVLTAMTGDEGTFAIAGIEPGRYTLTARKTGYVSAEFGEKRPGGPGTTLSITADQSIADLVLTLVPSGVLAGTIRDRRGDAAAAVEVTALRIGGSPNSPLPVTRTDGLGRFRLFDLAPGEYVLRAGTRIGLAWLPLYYPGTSDPEQALPLAVLPGSSRNNVDFVYDMSPVAEVQGRVRDPRGALTGPVTVSVVAADTSARQWGEVPMRARVRADPDGTFLLSGLASGRYNLIATLDSPASTGSPLRTGALAWDAQRVALTAGTRVSGVDLLLKPTISLSGRIDATSDPALRGSVVEITVTATDLANDNAVVAATPGDRRVARTASDGSFNMQGLLPGRYEVSVTVVAPPSAFAAAMMFHGTDVLDSGLAVVDTDVSGLEIVLAPRAASISGTINTTLLDPTVRT